MAEKKRKNERPGGKKEVNSWPQGLCATHAPRFLVRYSFVAVEQQRKEGTRTKTKLLKQRADKHVHSIFGHNIDQVVERSHLLGCNRHLTGADSKSTFLFAVSHEAQ